MDVVHYTATALNWTFAQLAAIVQTLLNLNYSCFSIVVKVFTFIYSNVWSVICETILICQCYLLDFITFLEEIGFLINVLAQLISNTGFQIASGISKVCSLVFFAVYSAYSHFINAVFTVADTFTALIDACHAFIDLIFSAALLLLLSIPNSFILSFELVVYLVQHLLLLMKNSLFSIVNSIYHLRMNCYNTLLNMPPKAYIGLVLLTLFFYFHRRITDSIKSFLCACAVIFILTYIKAVSALNYILVQIPYYFSLRWQRYRDRQRRFRSTFGVSTRAENVDSNNSSNVSTFHRLLLRARSTRLRWLDGENSSADESTNNALQALQRQLHEEEGKHLCVVCKDQDRNVMLLPCRHFCLCENCCLALQRSFSGCPICRREIVTLINVFV